MPSLNWIGKDAVVKHHKEVPFRLLEPRLPASRLNRRAVDAAGALLGAQAIASGATPQSPDWSMFRAAIASTVPAP
jgi:hypothetical protein